MKMIKYYQVSNFQIFTMAILVGIIAAGLITINMSIRDYLQLPVVTVSSDDKCVAVANYTNGEAYTCSDVGVVLRNYRVKKN